MDWIELLPNAVLTCQVSQTLKFQQSWDAFTEPYVGCWKGIIETDPKKLTSSQEFIGIIKEEYGRWKARKESTSISSTSNQTYYSGSHPSGNCPLTNHIYTPAVVFGTGYPGLSRVPGSGNNRGRDRVSMLHPASTRHIRHTWQGRHPSTAPSTDHIKTIQFIGIYGTYDPKNDSLIFNHGQSQAWSDTIRMVCILALWHCCKSRSESKTGCNQNSEVADCPH